MKTKKQLEAIIRETVKKSIQEHKSSSTAKPAVRITKSQLREHIAKFTQKLIQENIAEARKTSTFGDIPSAQELEQAIDDAGGWSMELNSADQTEFDAAMEKAGVDVLQAERMMNTGAGMRTVLRALMNAGTERAESLASSILETLEFEWV